MGKINIELGLGHRTESVAVDEKNLLGILQPEEHDGEKPDEQQILCDALDNPIGTLKLEEIVKPGEKVVILTSDITRPMPTARVMPQILERLGKAGVADEDITLIFARGSHRAMTPQEMNRLAGDEVFGRIRCRNSDTQDLIHVGDTKHGTPVDIDREVVEADRRICLGNIEYHYFAGYSGGAKAIMPGCSTRAAIQSNHSQMVDPKAHAGEMDENPVRRDLEEAAAMVGADFILNVVLDEHKKIVHAVAGDLVQAHRVGCSYIDELYRIEIKEQADIVLASQGGAPKDLNLYQTQKAIDNAKYAVRHGGVLIVVGSCKEGMGEVTFERWMKEAKEPQDLIGRIREDFQLGGHKAAAIAMVMERAEICLVSELDDDTVKSIFMTPYKTVQEAYDAAIRKCGTDAKVYVMPYAGSTMPVLL